ncbi:hypothetical protein INR49_020674 [Caranx melampygus]|nr:hypothetical protein INR49_020674 [Caranx melampygus]
MSSSGGRASPALWWSFTPAAPGGPVPCPASKRKCGEGGVLKRVRRSGGSGREENREPDLRKNSRTQNLRKARFPHTGTRNKVKTQSDPTARSGLRFGGEVQSSRTEVRVALIRKTRFQTSVQTVELRRSEDQQTRIRSRSIADQQETQGLVSETRTSSRRRSERVLDPETLMGKRAATRTRIRTSSRSVRGRTETRRRRKIQLRSQLIGCMSFRIGSVVSSSKLVSGWFHLLGEEFGLSKHLRVTSQRQEREESEERATHYADLRRTPDSAPDTDLNPPLLSPRCPSGPPPQLDSKTELSTADLQSAPQPWSNWTSSVPALFSSCSRDPRWPAHQSGLRQGDSVLQLNGLPVETWKCVDLPTPSGVVHLR